MQNGYTTSKPLVKPQHHLIRQSDLRNQKDRLFALFSHEIDQFHVDFCFSAPSHTMQQINRLIFLIPLFYNRLDCQLLFFVQKKVSACLHFYLFLLLIGPGDHQIQRIAIDPHAFQLYDTLFFHCPYNRHGNAILLLCPLPGKNCHAFFVLLRNHQQSI